MTSGKRRVERYELIVVGAGQAGLSAGYWFAKRDIDFLILDANARVGDPWRQRWDSLQLFTPARYSGLPGLRFPAEPYHLPDRNEVADYLEWYARVFELPVRNNVRVTSMCRGDRMFEIDTADAIFEAENIIIATGTFQTPRIPTLANEIEPGVLQLHSSEYRNPERLPDGKVLVVGAGNSGAQIALELAHTRPVTLAGRSVGSVPRRALGRDVFDWLWNTVMRPGADTFLGRQIRRNALASSDALIGMTEADLTRAGVERVGRVESVRDGVPILADGRSVDAKSIIWSTGFRPDFSWIDLPVFDDSGHPQHKRGLTKVPGLYFLGLRFLHRLNSSLVGGVGADAKFVANAIAARYGHTREVTAPLHFSAALAATL
jgi:putative flavoprotein involved in K+ transport